MAVVPLNGRVLATGDPTQAVPIDGAGHVQFTVIDSQGSTMFQNGDVIYVSEPFYIDASAFDNTIMPNTQYVIEDQDAVVQVV